MRPRRFYRVRAQLRPGEGMLATGDGRRFLERNLGRPKCRYDSALYAYRIDKQGLALVLGLPHPERLAKIMHRIRILTVTEYNRERGAVGKQRWSRGYEAVELDLKGVAKAARSVGRVVGGAVALDALPTGRTKPKTRSP